MSDDIDFDGAPLAQEESFERAGSDCFQAIDAPGAFQEAGEFRHPGNNELGGLVAAAKLELSRLDARAYKAAVQRVQSRLLNVRRLYQALHPRQHCGESDASQYLSI